MIISHLILKNWRNFRHIEVDLRDRVFLVGPNASGKSNFLDALRFLRDLAKDGGGLQKAVRDRGGLSKIRCLYARRYPDVEIEVHLSENELQPPTWKYGIGIKQRKGGQNDPVLSYEKVWKNEKQLVNRPNDEDEKDNLRLTQTYLEQINANAEFREVPKFLESILYLHLVPQLLRHPEAFSGPGVQEDPFGRNFLERVTKTPEKTRRSRLKKIEDALRIAVPQLKQLTDIKDEMGIPHLEAVYEHWRPGAGKQREDQFSDGTIRLIGLLWSLLESDSLLLLEEPELSLNAGITAKLPSLIYRLQKAKKRQVMLSTHSADLLSDGGIGGEEVLMLTPTAEGTKAELASSIEEVSSLLDAGLTVADAALPRATPKQIEQLSLLR
ncbi:chromosome segregation protein SMC [Phormidesmis priestleyi ULC007]|uniref:Chromosome segregation protein SMC n=1 Tax=Phormidesmis priestleyi ULC007 TaxID=1920490 RepID=A0A2T1DE61_9CYAN|nr:ATP-binding protein [Phormidesmis priestleyi]PSB18802.1 chromosome segregation protein SMC [Phormidesmis priestleyi ULC007]PZO51059.1 MAG: chromosome segregation protein SMC [Phormidesmis priestleyi]